jgi:hypothetical protein
MISSSALRWYGRLRFRSTSIAWNRSTHASNNESIFEPLDANSAVTSTERTSDAGSLDVSTSVSRLRSALSVGGPRGTLCPLARRALAGRMAGPGFFTGVVFHCALSERLDQSSEDIFGFPIHLIRRLRGSEIRTSLPSNVWLEDLRSMQERSALCPPGNNYDAGYEPGTGTTPHENGRAE